MLPSDFLFALHRRGRESSHLDGIAALGQHLPRAELGTETGVFSKKLDEANENSEQEAHLELLISGKMAKCGREINEEGKN